MALRRVLAGDGSRRSVPSPLRRGAAVVAVTGGALSLVGAAPAVGIDLPPFDAESVGPAGTGAALIMPVGRAAPAETRPVLLRSAVLPVAAAPEVVDATDLVKGAQLAEQEVARVAAERKAAQERAVREKAAAEQAAQEQQVAREQAQRRSAAPGAPNCGLDTSGLGPVKAHVRAAADFLGCLFGQPRMIGVASRAGTSDHPLGRAVDFMVDRATGDALADCALRNREALGITYVIWRQRINTGSGWKPMEDRGSVTANHLDHVHVSFGSAAGSGGRSTC